MTFIVGMNVYVSRATKRTHSVTQQRVGPHLVMEHKLWPLGPPPRAPERVSCLGYTPLPLDTDPWGGKQVTGYYWFIIGL